MPTYEYVCTDCGSPLEVFQSIHEPALTECPTCAGKLRKVFGNVGVVFKGSGFYRTDSRSKPGAAASAAKKPDAAGAGAKKPDPGPAATATTKSSSPPAPAAAAAS